MGEVRAFAADLSKVDGRLTRHLTPVVRRGGVNIKNSMQADLRKSSNAGFRYIASTVSYDEIDDGLGVEVGPVTPDGALENIAYFGSYKGGGTVRDPREALDEEVPSFLDELGKIAEGLVLGD